MFDEEPDRDPHGECRAEIHRLTAELAAARAVPGDVEAAIQAFDDACDAVGMYTAGPKDLTAEIRLYKDHDDARDRLRTAIARAISDATAARGTVGGLLATACEGEIVEFDEGSWWMQITVFGGIVRWRVHDSDDGWHPYIDDPSSWHCDEFVAFWLSKPARLVSAAEADADPSQRGPLRAAAPNLHPDGCHTADPTAPRDCTSDGHHECTSCARFDAPGRAAMGDDPIGGPRGPLAATAPVCPGPDCPMCNGEACDKCNPGPGRPRCDHDGQERHEPPTAAPRCSCTHEAGDSRCNVHPTCSECGDSTARNVDDCADHCQVCASLRRGDVITDWTATCQACKARGQLPKGG